jgi:hypothetical protein
MIDFQNHNFKDFIIKTVRRAFYLYFFAIGGFSVFNYIFSRGRSFESILSDALFFTVMLIIFEYREDNKKKNQS